MTVVAVIPARGGSKGVPGKNIKPLAGYPLLAWSIKVAQKLDFIDRVIVSTDSQEIADVATEYGVNVPFLRPAEISGDQSTDIEYFEHAINWYQKNESYRFDTILHLRPTTPLRKIQVVKAAYEKFLENPDIMALRSGHEMSETAYKCFEIDEQSGYFKRTFSGEFDLESTNLGRQSFPKTYSANGYIDILKTDLIIEQKKLHGNKVLAFETEPVIEVDSNFDFEMLGYQVEADRAFVKQLFE